MAKYPFYKTQPNGFWYALYYIDPVSHESELCHLALTREDAKAVRNRMIREGIENGIKLWREDFKIVLEDRRNER